VLGVGHVQWRNVAQYMLQSLSAKELAWARQHQAEFVLPPLAAPLPSRGRVVRTCVQARGVTTLLDDGHVTVWSQAATMQPPKKSAALELDLGLPLLPGLKARARWATDLVVVPELLKIVVSTGERELWFFDQATLETQFVVTQVEGTPLRLTAINEAATNTNTIVYADDKVNFPSAACGPN
jgi:hypothetical protein